MSLPTVSVSQTPEERFREYLASRPKPQRFTEQQRELVRHIFEKHQHFDTDELLDELRQARKQISRATVYRTLSKLVDAGLLRRLDFGQRTIYDHDYGYPWHEHLVCIKCGKMIEFLQESIAEAVKKVAQTHGFRTAGHDLIVKGTCSECIASEAVRSYIL